MHGLLDAGAAPAGACGRSGTHASSLMRKSCVRPIEPPTAHLQARDLERGLELGNRSVDILARVQFRDGGRLVLLHGVRVTQRAQPLTWAARLMLNR